MFEFNSIYLLERREKYFRFLFYDKSNLLGLLFDGLGFYYRKIADTKNFKEFSYECETMNGRCSVTGIRQDEGTYYVRLNNGAIFQISQSMADENAPYQLHIFDQRQNAMTPLGLTVYEAAIKSFSEAEVIDVQFEND